MLSRRGVLVGTGLSASVAAAGVVGVDRAVVPGRTWAFENFALNGLDGVIPDVAPGPTSSGSFISEARLGSRCGWTIAYPPGGRDGLPVVVVLHGRWRDHEAAFGLDGMGLERFLAQAVQQGAPPFAIASVDGGDTYWHARETGEDASAMIVGEFLPMLEREGLDTTRIGLYGWSMGGFGSLSLAGRLGPERVAGVAVISPALWHDFEDISDGAFDDEADFTESDVFGRHALLDGVQLRVDCGTGDRFYLATRDYVEGFSSPPAGDFQRGGHDLGYWRRMAPDQLRFLARALS
ncbi:MAG TPA: alpha/beta hydrolase-fold protein [Nocardioidaceae bacterium]|nr:alpha/beta hydrolase-fold protein [Nocardioidaceae bacterium]